MALSERRFGRKSLEDLLHSLCSQITGLKDGVFSLFFPVDKHR